jgi:putative transcriptional regulator
MIICQLMKLLSIKQANENRRITYRAIQEATGVSASTISRMATNKITRFDSETLSALCAYFGCELGDLLVYEENTK